MKFVEERYGFTTVTAPGARKKSKLQQAIFSFLLPNLQDGAKVLEIGPGRGEFAQACRLRSLAYMGIEPSEALAKQLEAIGLKIVRATVPPIPCENEQFDLVHADAVLEHLCSYREVMGFSLEAYRVLKPGGYLSVLVPNYLTLKQLFYEYEYQHTYITIQSRLKNLLRDCGFEIVTGRCFLLTLSPKLNVLDRIVTHVIIAVWRNAFVQGVVRALTSDDFVFRVTKNMYDQVAILARRPVY